MKTRNTRRNRIGRTVRGLTGRLVNFFRTMQDPQQESGLLHTPYQVITRMTSRAPRREADVRSNVRRCDRRIPAIESLEDRRLLTVIAYEAFDYPAGQPIVGQGTADYGFSTPWSNIGFRSAVVGSGSLAYPPNTFQGVPLGNSFVAVGPNGGAQGAISRTLAEPFGDSEGAVTRWLSFLIQPTSTGVGFNGMRLFTNNPANEIFMGWVNSGGIRRWAVNGFNPGGTTFISSDPVLNPAVVTGTTVWLVGKISFTGDNQPETVRLFVNPGTTEPPDSQAAATLTGIDFGNVQTFDIQWNFPGLLDDVIFGQTYPDVSTTPPPLGGSNTPPTVALQNTVTTLPEDTSTASAVKVADIVITDDGQGTNVLSLSGADASLFEIVGTALRIKAGSTLDFETNSTLDVTVNVDDTSVGSTPDDSKSLAIMITNVAPSVPIDVNGAANTVAEGAANDTLVGLTASSTDPNGPAVMYSLTDSAGGRFKINASSGMVSVADGSLLDGPASHSITVQASDGNLMSSQSFNISVTNLNPDAVDDGYATGKNASLTVTAGGTPKGLLFNDTDPAGSLDPLTVTSLNGTASLVGTSAFGAAVTLLADGGFTYDPRNAAALQVLAAGEMVNDTFTYSISDGDGGSDTATVTIAVSGVGAIVVDTNLNFVAPIAPPTVPGGDGVPDTIQLDLVGGYLEIRVNGGVLRSTPLLTAAVIVNGSSDADTVIVNGLGSGGLTINAAGGNDKYIVQFGQLGSVVNVVDAVAEGTDQLTVNGTSGADNISVTATQTTLASPSQTVTYGGNLELLTVRGEDGNDTFQVQPSQTATITIDGGGPSFGGPGTPPGDTLDFNPLGNTFSIDGKTILTAGGSPSAFRGVTFLSIETFNLTSALPLANVNDPGNNRRFDFNNTAAGNDLAYTSVLPGVLYSETGSAADFGWTTLASGFDRSAPNALLRDGHWAGAANAARTFRAEVPDNGWYLVSVTMGDNNFARDQMRVTNADTGQILLDGIATAAGQFASRTVPVLVTDSTLELTFSTTGGDPYWVVNSLELRPVQGHFLAMGVGPTGMFDPSISHETDGATVDTVTVFGTVAGQTYTVATTLGTILTADANSTYAGIQVMATGSSVDLMIRRPTGAGTALLTIVDVTGAKTGCTAIEYVLPAVRRFDFNGGSNATQGPVGSEPGFIGVRGGDLFTTARGYGWKTAATDFERGTTGYNLVDTSYVPLFRDGAWAADKADRTFQVQVTANTNYDVRVYVGDRDWARNNIQVSVEGGPFMNVANTAANGFVSLPLFGVSSTDAILEITFHNNGGDPYWMVNGMDVALSSTGLPGEAKERLEFGAAPGALSASLTNEALAAARDSALTIWSGAGLSAQQLHILSSTPIGLTDFGSQNVLGAAFTQIVPSIWIDNDAAGAGWHVDGSSSPAHGRADLLTVVLHEMGHILGLDHDNHAGALMASSLSAGTRLLPSSLPRLTAGGSTFAASVVPSMAHSAADFLTPSLSSPFNGLRVSSSQPFTASDQLFTRLGETDALSTDGLTPRVDALGLHFSAAGRTTDRRLSRAKRHHDDLFAAWDPSEDKIGDDLSGER